MLLRVVVPSATDGPDRTHKLRSGEVCDFSQCALVVLLSVKIKWEYVEGFFSVFNISCISWCYPALICPYFIDIFNFFPSEGGLETYSGGM